MARDAHVLAWELLHQRSQQLGFGCVLVEQRRGSAARHRADRHDVLVVERVHQFIDTRFRAAPERREFARRDIPSAQAADVVFAATGEIDRILFAIERHGRHPEMILAVVEHLLPRFAIAGAIPHFHRLIGIDAESKTHDAFVVGQKPRIAQRRCRDRIRGAVEEIDAQDFREHAIRTHTARVT